MYSPGLQENMGLAFERDIEGRGCMGIIGWAYHHMDVILCCDCETYMKSVVHPKAAGDGKWVRHFGNYVWNHDLYGAITHGEITNEDMTWKFEIVRVKVRESSGVFTLP
jgi:hypothetical protein